MVAAAQVVAAAPDAVAAAVVAASVARAGKTIRYAAYGSNLHPGRLVRRVPSARWLGSARVPDMALRFHKRGKDGSGKCNVVAGDGEVHVAVYEFETAEKPLLDHIEGLGHGYEAASLAVTGFGTCFTYTAADTHINETLDPFGWYKQLVLLGWEFNGFPNGYVEQIRAVGHVLDPQAGRREENLRLAREIANGDQAVQRAENRMAL